MYVDIRCRSITYCNTIAFNFFFQKNLLSPFFFFLNPSIRSTDIFNRAEFALEWFVWHRPLLLYSSIDDRGCYGITGQRECVDFFFFLICTERFADLFDVWCSSSPPDRAKKVEEQNRLRNTIQVQMAKNKISAHTHTLRHYANSLAIK